jgi:hypothetical protein
VLTEWRRALFPAVRCQAGHDVPIDQAEARLARETPSDKASLALGIGTPYLNKRDDGQALRTAEPLTVL